MHGWLCAVCSLLLVSTAYAQSAQSTVKCVITGHAIDAHHVPVGGVKILLQSADKKSVSSTLTDATGAYRFAVVSGPYTVRAESDGKGDASAAPVTASPDKIANVDLILQPKVAVEPQFFDEPQFTVAGVTDNTYRGGHGPDTVLRSAETLSKETASLSTVNETSGDPVKTVQKLQRAAEADPSEAHLFDWGTELLVHRAPNPATHVFTKGVALFPQSVRMQLGLATALYAAGSYTRAAEQFFKATDRHPSEPGPYLFLSKVQAHEITGSAGYEERMERFVRLQPDNALANYFYAVSVWNRRSGIEDIKAQSEVCSALARAIAINPHLSPAFLQLGVVYAEQRKYADAIRAYRQAIEADADLEEAHYRLSEAYRLTGDRGHAAEELEIYNKLAKASAEKLERERRAIQQFVIALRSQGPTPQTGQPQ